MDMPVLPRNQILFSQTSFTREPLPIDLAELQRRGHRTLEEYLEYVFAETKSKLVLPVLDEYLFPLVLVIKSVDGKAIIGFWQSPSCGQHCDKKERPHPCADNDDTIDCDLFCLGSLPTEQGDDKADRTRDLTRHSLCHTDHRGELTTCGILSIILHHHHHQPDRARLVGIELFIGCSDTQQSVFVVQCHTGLKISLK